MHKQLKDKHQINFDSKAWVHANEFNSAWVWSCPKEHCILNAREFLVVAHTYFGVRHECLRGLEGHAIRQKSGGGRDDTISLCDPFEENLVKATLPGSC